MDRRSTRTARQSSTQLRFERLTTEFQVDSRLENFSLKVRVASRPVRGAGESIASHDQSGAPVRLGRSVARGGITIIPRKHHRSIGAGPAALFAFAALAAACQTSVSDPDASSTGAGGTGAGGSGGQDVVTTSSSTSVSTTTTTTSTSSSGTGGGSCGDLPIPNTQECQACTSASCCAQVAKCGPGTECGDYAPCLLGCGYDESACFQQCLDSYPNGLPDLEALYTCIDGACEDACGAVACGEVTFYNTSCATCFDTNCCGVYDDCLGDPMCAQCLDDLDSVPGCYQYQKILDFYACYNGTYKAEC
jgi:hypothetical protein